LKILKIIISSTTILLALVTGYLCTETLFYTTLGSLAIAVTLLTKESNLNRNIKIIAFSAVVVFTVFHLGLLAKLSRPFCANGELTKNESVWENIEPINLDSINTELTKHNSNFRSDTLTSVTYKAESRPIIILRDRHVNNHSKRVLIIAGAHGTEPAGVFAIPLILNYIAEEGLLETYDINIIPTLNPIGLLAFARNNECNCDINRDFKEFSTKQTVALRQELSTNNYDMVIDLHEGIFSGHYVMSNNSEISDYLTDELRETNTQLSPLLDNSVAGFLYEYRFNNFLTNYGSTMTLLGYLSNRGVDCLVSESDVKIDNTNRRANNHLKVVKAIIDYLGNK